MIEKLNIIIADDHPIFRVGIESIIKAAGHNVLALAKDGLEAFEFCKTFKPDLLITDLDMPNLDGVKLSEKIKKEIGSEIRIIVLTFYNSVTLNNLLYKIGVETVLIKEDALENIIEIIEQKGSTNNNQGGSYRQNKISTNSLFNQDLMSNLLESLSKTEINLLKLISQSLPNKEIADKLFISPKTVENHRYNISAKLDLSGEKNSLLKFALENKLTIEKIFSVGIESKK